MRWDQAHPVAITTLDALIAEHGLPVFCKIDVEGSESEVLRGLSTPLPALSFEYIPATKQIALDCLDILDSLGDYQYNRTLAERRDFVYPDWQPSHLIADWLNTLPPDAPSGDIYARLSSG